LFDFDFLGRNQTPRIDFPATADIYFPDFNQSSLLRADFSSLVGISPDPFQAAAPQFCSVSSCLDFRGLDFSVDPSSHLVLHRLSTVRFFSVVSFRCQSSIFDSRIYLCRWFLVALLASVYPIFVVVLRFVCAQEFPVGAAVRFGLLAPPVCSPAARFHFSSLDSASALIRGTSFRPHVRPAVSPARDWSPLVFGSSALGFFDSIGFHFCAWSLLLGSTAARAHKVPSSGFSHGSSVPPHDLIFRFDCAASICSSVLNFL
jgi:hypothetical protein